MSGLTVTVQIGAAPSADPPAEGVRIELYRPNSALPVVIEVAQGEHGWRVTSPTTPIGTYAFRESFEEACEDAFAYIAEEVGWCR